MFGIVNLYQISALPNLQNFITHHTGFDSRQSPSNVHVTARPLSASGEDEFIVPEQHLKRRTGAGGNTAHAQRRPSPSSATSSTPTPAAASAGSRTSYRRYRTLGGVGGSSGGQRSSVRRRRKPVTTGRQR